MTWKDQAVKHAEECMPQESCGLLAIIKGEKTYWPCKNIAETGFEYFVIDPDDWAECEDTGEIIGVVHSHPNDPATPSDNDKASCDYLGLEWFIYSPMTKEWCNFKPFNFKSSLYGRTWIWGKQDCLSLIWDYFEEKHNLKLKNWPRPKDLKSFAQNPYFSKVLTESGFKKVDVNDIQPNDILLMEGIFNKLNHVALYIGDQTIFHHTLKKLSCREIYDLQYIKKTKEVYRYAA
tara:strand:- start:1589 stop:2290 length:702 start_codon:yes stop_codon:yes gene_type:complete